MLDLIIKNGTCYIDDNLEKLDLGIQNGKISHIGNLKEEKSKNTIDVTNKIVLPGLMDTQVHFREPVLLMQKIYILEVEQQLLVV